MNSEEVNIQLDPESRDAINQQSTLRCVCKAKLAVGRQSQEVIAWARTVVDQLNSSLAAEVELQPADISSQFNTIVLTGRMAYICFDIYTKDCDSTLRLEIDSSTQRPIHYVRKKAGIFFVRREASLDSYVAARYSAIRNFDAGPRPYFMDEDNPPVYDMGRRIEGEELERMKPYLPTHGLERARE